MFLSLSLLSACLAFLIHLPSLSLHQMIWKNAAAASAQLRQPLPTANQSSFPRALLRLHPQYLSRSPFSSFPFRPLLCHWHACPSFLHSDDCSARSHVVCVCARVCPLAVIIFYSLPQYLFFFLCRFMQIVPETEAHGVLLRFVIDDTHGFF